MEVFKSIFISLIFLAFLLADNSEKYDFYTVCFLYLIVLELILMNWQDKNINK